MSNLALVLVLISACMHAGWNLLGKKQIPSLAFFSLAMLGGAVLFAPLLLIDRDWVGLGADFWWLLLFSGCFQAVYMAGLAWAYARGEISVLYPLARALPVVLQAWMSVLWMFPVVALMPGERVAARLLLQGPIKIWVLAGLMVLSTYGLVLIAMAYTEDVSYLVALRQASIPLGALLGVFWLKETLSGFRWLSLALMMTGLVLVALN